MRLQIVSDLHNEVIRGRLHEEPPPLPDVGADVLVLAGDIDCGVAGVAWAAEQVRRLDIPAIYVAGNHEFYGAHYPDLLEAMREASLGTGVHVLEQRAVVIGGVRFLGSTLWTDFAGDGTVPARAAMPTAATRMPDYRYILAGDGDETLTPGRTRACHRRTRAWLDRALADEAAPPTVVVTHAAPLIDCRHPERPLDAMAGAFVSDLHPVLERRSPWLWIHGHTHANTDLYYSGVRVVSNQRGYPGEAVPGPPFDAARVVEI